MSLLISDPLGFLFLYFYIGIIQNGPIMLLLFALITSIVSYPFVFLGRKLKEYMLEDAEPWKRDIVVSIVLSLVFWIIVRLWYVLQGSIFTPDMLGFLIWVIITGVLFYLFYLGGEKLQEKLTDRWTMPFPISVLLTTYAMNLFGWFVLYLLLIVINLGVIGG